MNNSGYAQPTEPNLGFETLLTAKEAAAYLRVSVNTLGRMEQRGLIVPYRTPGGHRRYTLAMLRSYLEGTRVQP